jgi:hypothetical protein
VGHSRVLNIIEQRFHLLILRFLCLCCLLLLLLGLETNWRHSGTFAFPFNPIDQQACRVDRILQSPPNIWPIYRKAPACKSPFGCCDGFGELSRKLDVNGINGFVNDAWSDYLCLNGWGGGVHSNVEFLVDGHSEWGPLQVGFFAFCYLIAVDENLDKIWLLFNWLSST